MCVCQVKERRKEKDGVCEEEVKERERECVCEVEVGGSEGGERE